MNLKRMKLNSEMIKPLRKLVVYWIDQLEIAEEEIIELEKSNEHYQRRFDEVSDELERSKIIIKEKEKEIEEISNKLEMSNDVTNVKERMLEEIKDLAYDKIKSDYNMLN